VRLVILEYIIGAWSEITNTSPFYLLDLPRSGSFGFSADETDFFNYENRKFQYR
jgi:hypothetical protein